MAKAVVDFSEMIRGAERLFGRSEPTVMDREARDQFYRESGESLPDDLVLIDRAQAERVRAVAELAYEWVNAPEGSSIGRRAEDALTHAVDALQPGDLDEFA